MNFQELNKKIQAQFNTLCATGKLFVSNISGKEINKMYLEGFDNPGTFRDPNSNEYNCNCCNNFLRRYGNIVAIMPNGKLESMFSNLGDCGEYTNSASSIAKALENSEIQDVFFEDYNALKIELQYERDNDGIQIPIDKTQDSYMLGINVNRKQYNAIEVAAFPGTVNTKDIYEFHHFQINLPKQFVNFSSKSIEAIKALYRDKYSVFKRSMEEIPLDTLQLVKDLINQGSLLDGTAHLHSIEEIIAHKKLFAMRERAVTDTDYWEIAYTIDERTAKFKNTLIGVLCTELAEGMELNKACENWNKRVDPANYHKATAPITKRQIEEARKFVTENGYETAFNRSLVTSKDISIDQVLHSNSKDEVIKQASIFDNIPTPSGKGRHKRAEFDKLETVSIEKFMKDIRPNLTSMSIFLENRMKGNMCVLTTAVDNDSKQIFKWNNNYSWTFNGNLAGKSQIKENVKAVGGNVDGIVRCSLQWNDKETPGILDFDLHCTGRNHIYYANNGRTHSCGGKLDTDMIRPGGIGIENIFWKKSIADGKYKFKVHNYDGGKNAGFKIEIDMGGEIFHYYKSGNVQGTIDIAEITVRNGKLSIEHFLSETTSSKELWNLSTGEFHKVKLACLSPNHWGDNKVGNLHYMFMLEDCKAEGSIRSFHNENLISELNQHRKVMEVLGATSMLTAENYQDHLAGLGFNSTIKDEIIVRCKGSFNRDLKVTF